MIFGSKIMKCKTTNKKLPHNIEYSSDFYKEVLDCYNYEVKNQTTYGTILTSLTLDIEINSH